MNVILGASGQVGSNIVKESAARGLPTRAVVRKKKADFDRRVEVKEADFFDLPQLTRALEGGSMVFLLTPEDPSSKDIIGDTKQIINNYHQAIQASGIEKLVGLSCVGAHVEGNTGNILMSRMLELGFDDLNLSKVFIRPSYYFSNWLGFIETIEQYGVMPSFFPPDLKIDMNSPVDVAKFTAKAIMDDHQGSDKQIFELAGPEKYSSQEVAETFARVLNKKVEVQSIPKEQWKQTLLSAGFTDNTSENLIDMTQAVIDQSVSPEHEDQVNKLPTSLEQYLKELFKS